MALIVNENLVQIKQVGFSNDVTVNSQNKEITINIVDVFDED
ncbi:hypothetical protein [Staphylococcus chromogenes]|nr:hypothetical protein [Staphylococcus chromogenes]